MSRNTPDQKLRNVLSLTGIEAAELGRRETMRRLGAVIASLVVTDDYNEDVQFFRNRVRAAWNVCQMLSDAEFDRVISEEG